MGLTTLLSRRHGLDAAESQDALTPEVEYDLLVLDEGGMPISQALSLIHGMVKSRGGVTVVVGDHCRQGIATADEDCLSSHRCLRVSLGPVPLLSSHCIVLIHHYLDSAAAVTSGSPGL
mmetsp:Transcript_36057/g.82109  ORF Transcript_36057/g.82109 Transcript_36057/m.82109 type:complete len:119 (+) Transcript_36057:362-718(+)